MPTENLGSDVKLCIETQQSISMWGCALGLLISNMEFQFIATVTSYPRSTNLALMARTTTLAVTIPKAHTAMHNQQSAR